MAAPVTVACFGSLNRDLTVTVPRFPRPDETLVGRSVTEFWGGKGFNQAVAAARLGAATTMIGAVGDDAAGAGLLAALAAEGVDHRFVEPLAGVATGTAVPLVTDGGEVAIIIVPGANGCVGIELAERAAGTIAAADVLLVQGEIAPQATARAATLARAAGTTVVCNPAPASEALHAVLPLADLVVVNADEAATFGLAAGPGVVVSLGAHGAKAEGGLAVPAFPVPPERVVDPTGAGDSFVAALAVARAEGRPLADAVRFACAAGACAVQVAGAEPSLPRRAAVEALARR